MPEIHIRLVEDRDLAVLHARAELPRRLRVGVLRGLDDDEVRQERAHVQGRVHLRGRLPTPVLRPSHVHGVQPDGRGVDGAQGALPEAVREAGVVAARGHEPGELPLKGLVDGPEQLLGHVGAARHVRVRQAVPARRRAVPYLGKGPRVVAQGVADVVQAQGMGQVGVQHGHHMAVGAEGARLDFMLDCKIFNDSVGNKTCNLGKNGHCTFLRVHGVSCGCLVGFHKMP